MWRHSNAARAKRRNDAVPLQRSAERLGVGARNCKRHDSRRLAGPANRCNLRAEAAKSKTPPSAPDASGFTADQQFFLGFAQGWCSNDRPEFEQMLIATNPHAPPHFRVVGPLSNLPEFAEAFACKPGDRMVKADKCEVW